MTCALLHSTRTVAKAHLGGFEGGVGTTLSIKYPLIFTPAARAELIDAQDWYEKEARSLGRRFRAALDALVKRIIANPRQFPAVYKGVRRALLRRFPCALLFVIEADGALTVIACFTAAATPSFGKSGTEP